MPKLAKELGALAVAKIGTPGLHFVGVVPGLALQVTASGARSWTLRVVVAGKRRDMGLGGYPAVTLAQAHKSAREARELIKQGIDPIERQQLAQSALRASVAASLTFEQCAVKYMAAHESGWKNAKHGQQWRNTLAQHVYPTMGSLMVRDIALAHVLAVLEPIWRTKTETASRLRSRMELVLDWATARNYRDGLNPARWRGHLDKLLPAPSKVAKVEHHPAVAVGDIAGFMLKLRAAEGMGARALEFAILTAARSGEVRGATWAEIDRAEKVWTVPANRMKAGKEHRVPLSAEALAVLDAVLAMPTLAGNDTIFTAPRGGQLSDMTLSAVLRRMGIAAVPHGFRSTFRDWAGERTSWPNEMCELALAHTIGNAAEAAYRRGNMIEKRRAMMTEWAQFLATPSTKATVLPMKSKRA